MEAPVSFAEQDFRDRKVDVLRAVRCFSPDEVARYTVRARYTAGRVGERDIPNYLDEPGVQADRQTETFAEVTLFIDNWRWAGVRIRCRRGCHIVADHPVGRGVSMGDDSAGYSHR